MSFKGYIIVISSDNKNIWDSNATWTISVAPPWTQVWIRIICQYYRIYGFIITQSFHNIFSEYFYKALTGGRSITLECAIATDRIYWYHFIWNQKDKKT